VPGAGELPAGVAQPDDQCVEHDGSRSVGGALAGGASEATISSLAAYARNLGLAFQITDDLLDLEGDPAAMGKDVARDAHRANFATILGPESCRRLVDELLDASLAALRPLGRHAEVLSDLARVVRERRS